MLTNPITTESDTDTRRGVLPAVVFQDLATAAEQVRIQPGLFQSATVGTVTLTLQPGRAPDGIQTLDGNLQIDLHDPELSSLEFRLLDESETLQVEGEVSPLGTFVIVFRSIPPSPLRIEFDNGVGEETDHFWTHFASELTKAAAQLAAGGPPMKIPAIPLAELERVHGQAVRVKSRVLGANSKDASSTPESDSDSYLDASRRRFVFRLPCNDRTETGVFRIIAQDRDGRLIGSCRKTLELKPSMRNPDGYLKGEAFPEEFLPAEWLERAQELHFYCVPENAITNADPD